MKLKAIFATANARNMMRFGLGLEGPKDEIKDFRRVLRNARKRERKVTR